VEKSTNRSNNKELSPVPSERSCNESGYKKWRTKSSTKSVMSWDSHSEHHLNKPDKLRSNKSELYAFPSNQTATKSSISTYDPVQMTKILPRLYLGAYDDAMNEHELKSKGITHILSLTGNQSSVDFVEHEWIPMHDLGKTNLKQVLDRVSKFIWQGQQDGNNILVHCQSGQNRSATVVVALMMMKEKNTLYRAHQKVKNLRPVVQINERYAKQLLALEKEIFGKNSLPSDWMERGEVDMVTAEVTYKYEHVNSLEHQFILDSGVLIR